MKTGKPALYTDVETCVDDIIREVGKTIVLGLPLGLGKANNLANGFYRRAKQDPGIQLKILTALTLEKPAGSSELERRFLQPFVKRVFGDYPDLEYALAIRKGELPPNVELCEFFYKPGGYLNIPRVQENYISTNYTFAARDIVANGVNVMCQLVCKQKTPEGKILYSLSCNPDVSLDVLERLRREKEKGGRKYVTVAQVNPNLPFMYGDAVVEPESFHAVVEHPSYAFRLFGAPKMAVTPADYMIGLYASTLIKDGGTLQIGIGSLGDALVYGLKQRQENNDRYRDLLSRAGITDKFGELIQRVGGTGVFEQGLYGSTEMLVDGYMHLYDSGIIKRKVYNHEGLQRLLNKGKIDEDVTPRTLDALLEEGVISKRLTGTDVQFLKRTGIFLEGVSLENGTILAGERRIPADLTEQENLDQVRTHCLGTELKGGILIHAGFFLGPQTFYDALRDMSEEERKQIYMTSVLHVNQLYGNAYGSESLKLLQRRDARFVNAALMFTLLGAVISDGLENGQVVSGVGGQYNFVSMAHALPGGRSILMARSTRTKGSDIRSNVVWNYGHVTIPRHLRDVVITEYGIADLRGRTDKEIIEAMLTITDSRYQEGLLEKAKDAGKLPKSHRIPDRFRNNLPERIQKDLANYKREGLFPPFPFGTDFTEEELVLGKALRGLKEELAAKKIPIPSLDQARKILQAPEKARPYLERLELDKPANAKETMMQKMVIYALASQGAI